MDLPFNTIDSPNYELVVTIQFLSIVMTGYGYGVFSSFLLVTNDMIVDAAYRMTWYSMQPSMSRQVLFLLLRSQKGMQLTVGKFSKLRLETFTWVTYQLQTLQEGNDLPQLLKYACSYIAICSEVFTYCYAGEYLNMKSDMIVDTAYQISWYNLEPSMSRHVILLLLRSQKGLRLTFGKISTLSLQTFSGEVDEEPPSPRFNEAPPPLHRESDKREGSNIMDFEESVAAGI
nr:uncharacterized protein LOC117226905 [Megalopta genalis]